MKKNAFTLAELLGVITLLGLLALIVIPTIDKTMKEGTDKMYQSQIQMIESAAKMWGSDHIDLLPEQGSEKIITLLELQQSGYIDSDIKNPKTKEPFSESLQIKIIGRGTYYQYQVIES